MRGETDKKEEKEIRDTLLTSPSSPKVKEIHPPNLREKTYVVYRVSPKREINARYFSNCIYLKCD